MRSCDQGSASVPEAEAGDGETAGTTEDSAKAISHQEGIGKSSANSKRLQARPTDMDPIRLTADVGGPSSALRSTYWRPHTIISTQLSKGRRLPRLARLVAEKTLIHEPLLPSAAGPVAFNAPTAAMIAKPSAAIRNRPAHASRASARCCHRLQSPRAACAVLVRKLKVHALTCRLQT